MTQSPGENDYGQVGLLDTSEKEPFISQIQQVQDTFIYQIKGRPCFGYGDIWLRKDQRVICDANALLWMTGDLDVSTQMVGGCCTAYCRQCSGEGCCMNIYTAKADNERLTVGITLPGDVMSFGVTKGNGWILSYDAFVAGTSNLKVSSRFSGCCACFCGDEMPFMTQVTTEDQMALFLAGGYGMIERHDIPEGSTMLISRGLFFAAKDNTQFDVGLIGKDCGGFKNCCCTGGGIVFKFQGPTTVYTQSKNPIQLLRDFGMDYGGAKKYLNTAAQAGASAAQSAGNQGGGS